MILEPIFRLTKTKEYILVIEGSVPHFVARRKNSPNLSLCLLCRPLYRRTGIVRYCRQCGERLGECFLRITNIYSLAKTLSGPLRNRLGNNKMFRFPAKISASFNDNKATWSIQNRNLLACSKGGIENIVTLSLELKIC